MHKYLRMSKKSSTFAPAFNRESVILEKNGLLNRFHQKERMKGLGSPKISNFWAFFNKKSQKILQIFAYFKKK